MYSLKHPIHLNDTRLFIVVRARCNDVCCNRGMKVSKLLSGVAATIVLRPRVAKLLSCCDKRWQSYYRVAAKGGNATERVKNESTSRYCRTM